MTAPASPKNHLKPSQSNQFMTPMYAAIAAFRLGRADDDHYHALAFALQLANEIAHSVQRHRHLVDDLKPAFAALQTIHERQSSSPDGVFIGSPLEVDHLDNAVKILSGLIKAVPARKVISAITRLQRAMEAA